MNAFPTDLLVLFGRASALLTAAALGDLLLRRRASAAARHLVWSFAIAALLALPIASSVLPAWYVRVPIDSVPDVRGPRSDVRSPKAEAGNPTISPFGPRTSDAGPRTSDLGPRTDVRLPLGGAVIALVVYAAGIVLLLVRIAFEPFALRRLTRAAREVADPAWRRALADAAGQMGVDRPVRLLRVERDVMPLTFGTLAPVIVLPSSADAWTDDRRRAVLLHEMAHVARRDCFLQRLTALARAIYWPHPGVWWAARRMRVERELACDDRVLAAGAAARDYAGHLLEIAHTFRAAPAPATALGMARARQLEHRLLAILDEARNRASVGRGVRSAFALAAILAFVPMAVLRAVLVPSDASAPESSSAAAAQEFTGTWELHPSGEAGRVQVTIRSGNSTHGRTMALADLEKLAGTTLAAAGTVHFPIQREAGTFTIDGTCRNQTCAGTFVFTPNQAYTAILSKRGIGAPTPQEQFYLAAADVGTAYLDTLASTGYATPDIRLLVAAAKHGVDRGYVSEMAGLGYKLGTLDRLVRLRDHGVDPQYVRGMAAQGISKLSADELVRTRDHGVDPEYIRGLASLGYTGLSVDALVNARDHGIDPNYAGGMQRLGYKQTLDDLRRTRDHGVDPEYVGGLASLGYAGLSLDALVTARDHGVDPEYIRGMAGLGYKGATMEDLIRMRDHGVDPEYVRRLQQRGVSNLTVDDVIRRRDRGGE